MLKQVFKATIKTANFVVKATPVVIGSAIVAGQHVKSQWDLAKREVEADKATSRNNKK